MNVNGGPPFTAISSCPPSVKRTVRTLPAGCGSLSPQRVTFRISEPGMAATYKRTASSACRSYVRQGVIVGTDMSCSASPDAFLGRVASG